MAKSPAVTIVMIFMMLIPFCWAPGRADRVTPLFRFVCARDARFSIPRSGSIAGGNGSRLFVALAMDWFKCDWEDREGPQINQTIMVGSDGEVPVIAIILLPFGSSLRLSN